MIIQMDMSILEQILRRMNELDRPSDQLVVVLVKSCKAMDWKTNPLELSH